MNLLDEENMSFKPSSLWLKALYTGNCCKKKELVSNSCSDEEQFHKNPSGYSDISSNNYVNIIGDDRGSILQITPIIQDTVALERWARVAHFDDYGQFLQTMLYLDHLTQI